MSQTIALGIAVLNVLAVITNGILIKVMDKRADAKSAIIKALRKVYLEFGNTAAAGVPDTELESGGIPDYNFQGVEKAAREVQRLHWSSAFDIVKLNRIERILERAMITVVSMTILAIASTMFGLFGLKEEGPIQDAFRYCIPGMLFFCEVVFFVWIVNTGSYLKGVENKYNNSEY